MVHVGAETRDPHSFAGLGVVGKKLHHKRENEWDWEAADKAPIPFVTVNGTKDDPDEEVIAPREKSSWVDSYAEARGSTATRRTTMLRPV